MANKGQNSENSLSRTNEMPTRLSEFVLDKSIFSNVFERDIRRIYIYRKSERLAKAIQLITPAFIASPALRNRLDGIAIGLIDAAILPPHQAREALSRELLALSSILSVARTGGLLSDMNANLIAHEAHTLLQESASYEEPLLDLEENQTLAELTKRAASIHATSMQAPRYDPSSVEKPASAPIGHSKGHTQQNKEQAPESSSEKADKNADRQQAILSILQTKGPSYIKDISMVIRTVSEKTIQRELQTLVSEGKVNRNGERRWTQYSLPA